MLFAARIVDGITGGNIIVAQAYITDITPREKRTAALGYVFAVFGLGFIVGPALGGVLSAALGPRIPFLLAAAAALVAALMSWRVLDETVTEKGRGASRLQRADLSLGAVVNNTPLLVVLAIAFVGQFALGMLQATFALYGQAVLFQGASEEMVNLGVGLLLAAVGATQLFTQVALLERLLERFGDLWLVYIGSILRAAGLVLYAVITSPWLAGASSVLFAMGMALLRPSLQSLATQTVGDEMRGGVLGFYQSAVSLATIISTAIAGVIFAVAPTVPFWLGALLSLLALIPAVGLPQQLEQRKQELEQVGAAD
jgi:DHA1 family tetracycline resistance protein-like MFS transporter